MKRSLVTLAWFAGVSCLPCIAAAQAAAPAAQPGGEFTLQEVIVTAQRRTESAQRAAVPVSVLQPTALARVTRPENLGALVPALQMTSAGGTSVLIYVRGVGTFSVNPYTDSGVAVNYDGVYIGRAIAETGFFYDLDRIEVLKGPQGTLYGRNTTGGVLNVIPNRPVLNSTFGDLSVDGGNYGAYNVQGAVNIPLGDKAALRFAGNVFGHNGYNTDGTYTGKGQDGRIQLRFDPSATISNRIAFDYAHVGGTGGVAVLTGYNSPVGSGPYGAFTPTGFNPNVGWYDPRTTAVLNSPAAFVGLPAGPFSQFPERPHSDNNYYGLTDELNVDLGFGALTTIAAWRHVQADELFQPGLILIDDLESDRQISLESRLSGTAGPVDWLGGIYYYNESVHSNFNPDQNTQASTIALKEQIASYAAFGRLTYHVNDRLRLTAAGRFTHDYKRFDGIANTALEICTGFPIPIPASGICPGYQIFPGVPTNIPAQLASIGFIQPAPGAPFINPNGQTDEIWALSTIPVNGALIGNKFTYRLAFEYDLRPKSLFYASYETGYRSGGFALSTVAPTYKPETIDAFTIGVKNRFFSDRLQVNVEGFIWKYHNQQITHFLYGRTGGVEFGTQNVGLATSRGFEIDAVGKPAPDTLLSADIQYLNAIDNEFTYSQADFSAVAGLPPGTLPPPSTCPYTLTPPATYTVNCSGLTALNSPLWTMNLGAQQSFHPTDDYKVTLEVDTHYQTNSILMFERRAGGDQPAYWLVDASVTLLNMPKKWSLAAYVQNIGDVRPKTMSGYDSTEAGFTTAIYGPPRLYGARLQVHF